jgi:hypothetical protein
MLQCKGFGIHSGVCVSAQHARSKRQATNQGWANRGLKHHARDVRLLALSESDLYSTLYACIVNRYTMLELAIDGGLMDPVRNPYSPGAGRPPAALVGRDSQLEGWRIALDRSYGCLGSRFGL